MKIPVWAKIEIKKLSVVKADDAYETEKYNDLHKWNFKLFENYNNLKFAISRL